MYHGILIDQSFEDLNFPNKFKVFAKKQDGSWGIYGVEVEDVNLDKVISEIQKQMKSGTWYVHFYNKEGLIVVFKEKIFRVNKDISIRQEMIEYGKSLGIPEEQLKVSPTNFENEKDYFKKEDFING